MKKYLYSVGIWAFGSCPDRFCESGYQESRNFKQKVDCASKVKGLDGIEVHYNGDFDKNNVKEIKKIIDDSGLKVSAINCEIFGDRVFRKGALISKNPEVRNKAINTIKEAAEMAKILKVSLINLWPGADGYDYPFQIDYIDQWDMFMEAIKDVVISQPDIKFSLEYKLREPRIRSALSTVGKALMIIQEIGVDNLGVTLDFGHSIMAKENPAESVAILQRYGKLFHTHINDNSRDWDDDLIIGTYHLWETLEFIYYLKKTEYSGWLGFDMSPARENQIKAVEYSIEMTNKLLAFAEKLETEEIQEALNNMDALASYKYMFDKFIK